MGSCSRRVFVIMLEQKQPLPLVRNAGGLTSERQEGNYHKAKG